MYDSLDFYELYRSRTAVEGVNRADSRIGERSIPNALGWNLLTGFFGRLLTATGSLLIEAGRRISSSGFERVPQGG